MIPGLHSYATEHQLVAAVNLRAATVGLSAELLAGLNSAEIAARLLGEDGPTYIVVFDGPARTTPSRLDDGLERRRVQRALADAGIRTVVAPALAAAQLAHLAQQRFVSHVAGADEALLWGDVTLVLDVFAEHPVALRRAALLSHLRLSEHAFVEVVLGAGHNAVIESPLPVLEKAGNPIEGAVRAGIHYGGPAPPPPPPPPPPVSGSAPPPLVGPSISVYRAAQAVCDPAYVASLQRALTFVARQPILSEDGTIVLENRQGQPVPRDLTEVIGCQLGPEAYWYLNRGILGPELLRGMLWSTFTDCYRVPHSPREPFAAFERLQRALSPLRQQAYALLAQPMHRYFQVKEVVNRTPGGLNFVRTQPAQPPAPESDEPAAVVAAAVRHARELAKLGNAALSELPEALAREAMPQSPSSSSAAAGTSTPPAVHIQAATLALRELVEATVVWYLAMGKVPRSIDTAALARALPWA